MSETMNQLTNSTPMYLLAAAIIGLVVFQALLFLVRAWRQGKKVGMDMKKLRRVVISSATFTVMPSVAILVGVLALVPALGVPLPWVRLSIVGSLQYEAPAASNVAKSLGLGELPSALMTKADFASIALAMTLGVMTTSFVILFFYKSYQKKMTAAATKDARFTDVLFSGVFLGMVSAYVGDAFGKLRTMELTKVIDGVEQTVTRTPNVLYVIAAVCSAAVMLGLTVLIKKKKLDWLENYSFALSILVGMAASIGGQYLFPTLSAFVE